MDIFSKRPLFTSCMLFIACSVIGFFIPSYAKLFISAFCAVALIFLLILALIRFYSAKKKNIFLTLILCVITVMLSFISSYLNFDTRIQKMSEYYGNDVTVNAVVTSEESQNNFASRYKVSVKEVNGRNERHTAIVECGYAAALEPGDVIKIKARASSPEDEEGRFNEKLSLYSDNIFVIYSVKTEDLLDVIEYARYDEITLEYINLQLSDILTNGIGGEEGDLCSALLLGNKQLLESNIVRDFRRAGVSHILALSGLHMSIVMGIAMFIMRRLTQKKWLIATTLSLLALTYLGITGFSISATRAVLMLLIVYLSLLISGVPDPLTSLSIAGTVILLVSPGAVADAGFWMSFSATLGILVYLPPINDYFNDVLSKYDNKIKKAIHKVIFSIITAISTSFAAIIPLIGVSCIFGKEISEYSVLSSLVLSVPTTFIIFLSLLFLPFCSLPLISGMIVEVLRFMANLMIDYCDYVSNLDDIVHSLNYPFATLMAVLLSAALLYSFVVKRHNPFMSLIPFAVCLIIFGATAGIYEYQNKDSLKVSYINASSNSDMIVLSNERNAVICDISNGSRTSYDLALDEVFESRATEIQVIMLTRYTNKHLSTLTSIFKSNKVRQIWLPNPSDEEDLLQMERIYDCAIENGVEPFVYNFGDDMHLFEHTTIEHMCDYIDRSVVPISLIAIRTGRENLTYCSPAFNESDLADDAEYYFARSTHIVFGNRGPRTKTEYTVPDTTKLKSIAFADDTRIFYYVPPERSLESRYLVEKEIEYYLDK